MFPPDYPSRALSVRNSQPPQSIAPQTIVPQIHQHQIYHFGENRAGSSTIFSGGILVNRDPISGMQTPIAQVRQPLGQVGPNQMAYAAELIPPQPPVNLENAIILMPFQPQPRRTGLLANPSCDTIVPCMCGILSCLLSAVIVVAPTLVGLCLNGLCPWGDKSSNVPAPAPSPSFPTLTPF